MDVATRAETLRVLHAGPDPLVLVNVWDVASARTVAAQPGCRAIATASWSIAAALGAPDGEGVGRDAMLEVAGRIAAAVALPVSADLERGYGASVAEVAATAERAWALGVAGCNVEDGLPAGGLRDAGEAAERVRAAAGAGLVVNARTDAFLLGVPRAFGEAVARGRAFLDAGATCVFVPGVTDGETIARLVGEIGPLSVLATPASPPLAELAGLGVRRVSVGPGALGIASAALARAAADLLAEGPWPDDLGHRPPVDP